MNDTETTTEPIDTGSIDRHLERGAELQQARRASVMAHSVVIKLKEMGLPDELDGELSQVCTDLGDLWSAQNALVKQMEAFLKSPDDWDAVGDTLTDLRATIEHVSHHVSGVGEPLTKITEYAYGRASEE